MLVLCGDYIHGGNDTVKKKFYEVTKGGSEELK